VPQIERMHVRGAGLHTTDEPRRGGAVLAEVPRLHPRTKTDSAPVVRATREGTSTSSNRNDPIARAR